MAADIGCGWRKDMWMEERSTLFLMVPGCCDYMFLTSWTTVFIIIDGREAMITDDTKQM